MVSVENETTSEKGSTSKRCMSYHKSLESVVAPTSML
jgi:hypothetical protein